MDPAPGRGSSAAGRTAAGGWGAHLPALSPTPYPAARPQPGRTAAGAAAEAAVTSE